jgi:hypothetical protein
MRLKMALTWVCCRNDYPFRAAQSLLAYHTRTQNAIALGFAEALHTATKPQREATAAALAVATDAGLPPPMERTPELLSTRNLARNRWHLTYTLLRNPQLCADRYIEVATPSYSILEQRSTRH